MSTRKSCVVTSSKGGSKALSVVDILVIVGAALGIVYAIFDILGFGLGGWGSFILGYFWNLAWAIVAIIVCAALLSGLGYIPNFKFQIKELSWIWLIVLGILIMAPTGNYGGGVIIVAGIVKIFC